MASHDVFISYSSQDKVSADGVCHGLEARGVRCWMAPRDVIPGSDWQTSLLDAISDARVVVLLFTAATNSSEHIKREITAAFEGGTVVIPFRLENVMPQGALRYHLTGVHWLDAFQGSLEPHVEQLATTIQRVLERPPAGQTAAAPVAPVIEPVIGPGAATPAQAAPAAPPTPLTSTVATPAPAATPALAGEPKPSTIMSPPAAKPTPPLANAGTARPAASPQSAGAARPAQAPAKSGVRPWMIFAGLAAVAVLIIGGVVLSSGGGGAASAAGTPAADAANLRQQGVEIGVGTRPEPPVTGAPIQPLEGVPQDPPPVVEPAVEPGYEDPPVDPGYAEEPYVEPDAGGKPVE